MAVDAIEPLFAGRVGGKDFQVQLGAVRLQDRALDAQIRNGAFRYHPYMPPAAPAQHRLAQLLGKVQGFGFPHLGEHVSLGDFFLVDFPLEPDNAGIQIPFFRYRLNSRLFRRLFEQASVDAGHAGLASAGEGQQQSKQG